MYAMAGGTLRHNLVCANAIRVLGNAMRGGPCRVVGSDQRVRGDETGSGRVAFASLAIGVELSELFDGLVDLPADPEA